MGQNEPVRAQLASASMVVAMYSPALVFCTLSSVLDPAFGATAAACDMARSGSSLRPRESSRTRSPRPSALLQAAAPRARMAASRAVPRRRLQPRQRPCARADPVSRASRPHQSIAQDLRRRGWPLSGAVGRAGGGLL